MDRALLEGMLAEGLSLEEMGRRVGRHATTVAYWLKKHGLSAVHSSKYAPKGGIDRERLSALVGEGLTVAEMASRLGLSTSTVMHWLRAYGLQTERATRRAEIRSQPDPPRTLLRTCRQHGRQEFVRRPSDGSYRCHRCNAERVAARRRSLKELLVAEAGGRCALCGYERYVGALQLHHLDPMTKAFGLGSRGLTRSLERLQSEARKCILLCANCHAEVEGGIVRPPGKSATGAGANL